MDIVDLFVFISRYFLKKTIHLNVKYCPFGISLLKLDLLATITNPCNTVWTSKLIIQDTGNVKAWIWRDFPEVSACTIRNMRSYNAKYYQCS